MSTTATFHYLRDGNLVGAGTYATDCDTAQEFADALAKVTKPSYCDQVQVWFGEVDGREPDAVAEVTA